MSYNFEETPFKAALDTSTVLRTEACGDFIVSVCESPRGETAEHAYDIMKDLWKVYKKPVGPKDWAVVLDGRLVIITQQSANSAMEIRMYDPTNLAIGKSTINTSSYSELSRRL